MALITCHELCLSYGSRPVVQGLSFSLEREQRILVCGENGSGKSTLLRALVGLHAPSGGTLSYEKGVRKGLGYLPQKAGEARSFPATAREVAASGLRRARPWLSAAEKQRVSAALSEFGAQHLAKESFGALSGGQRQRVLLARARLCATHALLLDEPVTGLDPKITHELYHCLRALSREGLGVLFVSHDVAGALGFCTHVLHLTNEGVAHFYTAEEYRKSAHFCALCKEVHHA